MVKLTHGGSKPHNVIGTHCTVEQKNATFCDAPAWPDAPFPICRHHAVELYMTMRGIHNDALVASSGLIPGMDAGGNPYQAELEQRISDRSAARRTGDVVYYVRIGDSIKIGYTSQLDTRIKALRAARENVLATEPGGRELEAKRHAQFGRLRKGRREDFEPSFALIQHIDDVRERHGRPVFK